MYCIRPSQRISSFYFVTTLRLYLTHNEDIFILDYMPKITVLEAHEFCPPLRPRLYHTHHRVTATLQLIQNVTIFEVYELWLYNTPSFQCIHFVAIYTYVIGLARCKMASKHCMPNERPPQDVTYGHKRFQSILDLESNCIACETKATTCSSNARLRPFC